MTTDTNTPTPLRWTKNPKLSAQMKAVFRSYLFSFNFWIYLSESHWISAFVVTRIREDQKDCQLQNTVVASQQADTRPWQRHWLNLRRTDIAPFCNQCSRHLRFYDWTDRRLQLYSFLLRPVIPRHHFFAMQFCSWCCQWGAYLLVHSYMFFPLEELIFCRVSIYLSHTIYS